MPARARGQPSRASILMSHPFLAEIPVPGSGLGLRLHGAITGFLNHAAAMRWPGDGNRVGEDVTAWAFAAEDQADEFVRTFLSAGARRVSA